MNTKLPQVGHPTNHEQDLAVAIVLWIMLAGMCVLAANAWASGLMPIA